MQEKKSKVDAVIRQLALQACQNTIIGSTLDRGVSGGEASTQSSVITLSLLTAVTLTYTATDWYVSSLCSSCLLPAMSVCQLYNIFYVNLVVTAFPFP